MGKFSDTVKEVHDPSTLGGTKKKAPEMPAAPDYIALIKEQARQNRVDTKSPYGSQTYEQTPDGRWTSTTSFAPEVQGLLDRQLNLAGTGTGNKDYGQYQDMAMAMARRQLDPVYDRQHQRFEQTMANRGTPVGSEIYSDGYRDLSDAESKAYQDAAFNALQFGAGLRSQDDARTQQDYNMLASVLGNVQGQPTQPLDVMGPFGAQQQTIQNNYNQQLARQQQGASNFWNTAGTVGAAFVASDPDIKESKTPIDTAKVLASVEQLDVERWKYIGIDREHIGPYADQFRDLFGVGDGKTINLIDVCGVLLASVQALTARIKQLEAA